jgi:murein DD-endopeptidase MepM/ murein hydrolase activator NlpD
VSPTRIIAAAAVALCCAAPAYGAAKLQIVFPVVGEVSYTDDFGDARGASKHEGNDLMAPKRATAVAAEGGTVTFWTTSASAGCMLYLHGDSGTTYWYIHLNNDRTLRNDNRGKCVAGTAYAKGLHEGDHVEAGQAVGYVGDSGDANGIASHLHFEIHPKNGKAVDPFPYLQRAQALGGAGIPVPPTALKQPK